MYALAFPAIDPVAVEIGPLAIRWYALAYVAGHPGRLALHGDSRAALASRGRAARHRRFRAVGDARHRAWRAARLCLFSTGRAIICRIRSPPLRSGRGGMSFHGGLCGVVLAAALFASRRGIPWLALGDLVSAAAPIGLFFGRLANFVNGELYGRPTIVPWGMVFPNAGPEPRHPSQLYEAALEGLVLFAICAVFVFAMRVDWRERPVSISRRFLHRLCGCPRPRRIVPPAGCPSRLPVRRARRWVSCCPSRSCSLESGWSGGRFRDDSARQEITGTDRALRTDSRRRVYGGGERGSRTWLLRQARSPRPRGRFHHRTRDQPGLRRVDRRMVRRRLAQDGNAQVGFCWSSSVPGAVRS